MDFKKLLKQPEYDFLRTNEHLGDNICLLTLGGSHAYGTNVEGSDVDIRGVAMGEKNDELIYCHIAERVIIELIMIRELVCIIYQSSRMG